MKAPRPSNATAVVVLVVLLTIAAVLPQSLIVGFIEMGLVGLLAAELDRSGRRSALRLVDLAARLVSVGRRAELADEWSDHVLVAGEQGLRPLIAAVSVMRAGITTALRYRTGKVCAREQANAENVLSNRSINDTLGLLSHVLEMAVEYGHIQFNPAGTATALLAHDLRIDAPSLDVAAGAAVG